MVKIHNLPCATNATEKTIQSGDALMREHAKFAAIQNKLTKKELKPVHIMLRIMELLLLEAENTYSQTSIPVSLTMMVKLTYQENRDFNIRNQFSAILQKLLMQ